jgi:hypothetical protein
MMAKMNSNERVEAPVAAGGDESRAAPTVSTTAVRPWITRRPRLFTFFPAAIVVWGLGTFVYVYFYPHLLYNALERAIIQRSFLL